MAPLKCTTNSLQHIDYGIPLLASKFTDYRTSTGKNHSYHPEMPQEFDCRVKARFGKDLLNKDICIRDDVKSEYTKEYYKKFSDGEEVALALTRALPCDEVIYIRNLQEKLYQKVFLPLKPGISEMKDSYRMKHSYDCEEVPAPITTAKCEVEGFLKPLQPSLPPEGPGFWKYLDIYMTDNRLKYRPYTLDEMEKVREDLVTLYSARGDYKPVKLPGPSTGNSSIYDKRVFKNQFPHKFLSRAPKRVPNMGMQSEYQGHYQCQTKLKLYPYIHEHGINFEDSLPGASPWQNLCPPGMYCTEQYHVGSNWPIRAVVDIGKPGDPIKDMQITKIFD